MPQGERPQKPIGEQNEQGAPPEIPEDIERPEMPDNQPPRGERPDIQTDKLS